MGISYSRISSFRSCHAKHYYEYVVGIVPRLPVKALSFGTDFHRLMELRVKGTQDPMQEIREKFDALSFEEQEALEGDAYLENLQAVYDEYEDWGQAGKTGRILEEAELRFELPMPVKINGEKQLFTGMIDLLEIDENGDYHISDYKTFNRAPDKDSLVLNLQSLLYAKAVQLLYGKYPKTMTWIYIKNTAPMEPAYLEKSKRLSRAFSSGVTLKSWQRAVERYALDEKPLTEEELQKLKNNQEDQIFKVELPLQEEAIEVAWQDFVKSARMLRRFGKSEVMNIGRDCSWCNYKPLCMALLTGGDVAYTAEKEFKRRENHVENND